MNLCLEVGRLEIESETQIKLHQLELESMKSHSESVVCSAPLSLSMPVGNDGSTIAFDISKQIVLVPQFRENKVESYFNAFERIASSL